MARTAKGITATINSYTVDGFAMVDGKPESFEDVRYTRDSAAARREYAKRFGCKPSQVVIEYKLNRETVTINANKADFIDALNNAGIDFEIA